MTPLQRLRVGEQQAQGFKFVSEAGGVVRLERNGDQRLIQADGTIKRGQPDWRGRR